MTGEVVRSGIPRSKGSRQSKGTSWYQDARYQGAHSHVRLRCGALVRVSLMSAVAVSTSACANLQLDGGTPRFASPMNLINTPANAADAPKVADVDAPTGAAADPAHKSMAAKVLASRALETVTGLKTDPARLSEHD